MGLSSPSDGSTRETYHRGRKRALAGAIVACALASLAWLVARWRPSRIEIQGDSMAPTLLAGDRAVAVSLGVPKRGHVVVLEHPHRPGLELVKRVLGAPGDLTPEGGVLSADEFWVEGDDPSRSTDSRQLGPVRRVHLRARVWAVYWPVRRCAIIGSVSPRPWA